MRITKCLYSNLSSGIISVSKFCSKYLHVGVICHSHNCVELSVCIGTKAKAYGGSGIKAPVTLNVGIRWKRAVSFTLAEINTSISIQTELQLTS